MRSAARGATSRLGESQMSRTQFRCGTSAGKGSAIDSRVEVGEGQHDDRDGGGDEERAPVDGRGLVAQRRRVRAVSDRLFPGVQVARPPGGQRDSGLLARLQQPESRHPERKEDDQPRPARRAERHQHERDSDGDRQGDNAEQAPLAPLARADVCNLCRRGVHHYCSARSVASGCPAVTRAPGRTLTALTVPSDVAVA